MHQTVKAPRVCTEVGIHMEASGRPKQVTRKLADDLLVPLVNSYPEASSEAGTGLDGWPMDALSLHDLGGRKTDLEGDI